MPLSLKASIGSDGLLKKAEECSTLLRADLYNPVRYLQRGLIYSELGYPDLAAADAYYALSLLESVIEPDSSDYAARKHPGSLPLEAVLSFDSHSKSDIEEMFALINIDGQRDEDEDNLELEPLSYADYLECIDDVYLLLVESLVQCGCWRDAYEYCIQGMKLFDEQARQTASSESFAELLEKIKRQAPSGGDKRATSTSEFNPAGLENRGYAKRVVYPWNTHEPDRNSPEIARLLNERLQRVAPKCEVRAVELPCLHDEDGEKNNNDSTEPKISIQLGLFAKEDIAPGEVLLHESSMLTATNRLHDDICDACHSPLPSLSSPNPPKQCETCAEAIFCSSECHDTAQETYHGAICGMTGFESIGKDTQNQKDKPDNLYLLLLARTIAMSATQRVHPLELPEVKYIWGDFHELGHATDPPVASSASLPFSLQLNVIQPMRMLDEMGADPYKSLPIYNTWVFNTLYAKFRGTASGRLSTWDGAPEVCAVHPLWCLANHSCDPNVRWEWGGEITFMARTEEERVKWGPEDRQVMHNGIKKGEEILNHYCDLNMKVKERREWAMGALGGSCQCERCIWEASQSA